MRSAFSLIELIIAVGIIAIILSFSSINLLSSQRKAYLDDEITLLASDIHTQQLRAMTADSEGTSAALDFGIYFTEDSYTTFSGNTYDPNAPGNYQTTLPETIRITEIPFAQSQLVFTKGSGEIYNFDNNANSFTISDSAMGESKTFIFNALGVITEIE